MAKLKATNTKIVKTKSDPPKKGILSMVVDAVKNPEKYIEKSSYEKYVPKNVKTKNFNVTNPAVYKDRAKRYNDSLSLYNKGEVDRVDKKKKAINAINNYNKNKNFYEPKLEYGGEEKFGEGAIRQTAKHAKNAQSHSKLLFSTVHAFAQDEKGNYPGAGLISSPSAKNYLERSSDIYPKPEYRPNFVSKKAKATVSKPKVASSKATATKATKPTTPTKSNNSFTVKKTSMPKAAPKPTVKPVVKDAVATKSVVSKPIVRDTVAAKPIAKPVSAPVPKPAQKIPAIKSSNNYGDTATVRGGPYVETKSKMPAKKAGSQFKTVKKNYN
tara:strand:+ start:463 stop:1443 length:981 start_codon:yes stop_codon:yes gene_type:complete